MSFEELLTTPQVAPLDEAHRQLPPEWRPGVERKNDGSAVIVTPGDVSVATQAQVDEYIQGKGFDPLHFMLRPGTGILVKDWTALRRVRNELGDYETVVQDLHSSRIEVVPRGQRVDMEELFDEIRFGTFIKEPIAAGLLTDGAFGVAVGDLQLGKVDGDGPSGTVARFQEYIDLAAEEFKTTRLPWLHLAFLGDCLEGMVSQGGRNAWRTCLTTTEQTRLLRRLILWAIDRFIAAGAEKITVVSVPGNHDEAQREPVSTRVDDSWAIEALVAVSDAMELNPQRYGHVTCVVPGIDQADVTMEVAGFPINHNHGHLYSKGNNRAKSAFDWWKGMLFSNSPAGHARLMLGAHGHNFQVAEESGKTWCMIPALEELSVWWFNSTGQTGDPGIVVFTIQGGELMNLSRRRLPKKKRTA